MSECVVRMEMPDNCECCPMVYTADVQGYHWCAALEQEVEQGLSRPKDCPIICSLPEGHGRLVDADAIEYVISENGCQDDFAYRYDINELHTIVPAERNET